MGNYMTRPARRALMVIAMCLSMSLLTGCKESLYSNLTEREANEAYVVLTQAGIRPTKSAGAERDTWTLHVESRDLPAAVEALTRAGMPRRRFVDLGDMFQREGIVSTPTEERVRFIHGVSQELSETLTVIDGVTDARVHLVVPENDPLADVVKASSASVFVKHRANLNMEPLLPSIKSLVLRSVEGLTFDTVYVSLFPASPQAPQTFRRADQPLLGITVPENMAKAVNFLVIALFAAILAAFLWLFVNRRSETARRTKQSSRQAGVSLRGALATKASPPVSHSEAGD